MRHNKVDVASFHELYFVHGNIIDGSDFDADVVFSLPCKQVRVLYKCTAIISFIISFKDSRRLVVRSKSVEEVDPSTKTHVFKMRLNENLDLRIHDGSSMMMMMMMMVEEMDWSCFLQNSLHSVMDMQNYDTMESQRTLLLYVIFSFLK